MTFTQKMDDWLTKWVPQERPPAGSYLTARLHKHIKCKSAIYAVCLCRRPRWFFTGIFEDTKVVVTSLLRLPAGSPRPTSGKAADVVRRLFVTNQSARYVGFRAALLQRFPHWQTRGSAANKLDLMLKLPRNSPKPHKSSVEYGVLYKYCAPSGAYFDARVRAKFVARHPKWFEGRKERCWRRLTQLPVGKRLPDHLRRFIKFDILGGKDANLKKKFEALVFSNPALNVRSYVSGDEQLLSAFPGSLNSNNSSLYRLFSTRVQQGKVEILTQLKLRQPQIFVGRSMRVHSHVRHLFDS